MVLEHQGLLYSMIATKRASQVIVLILCLLKVTSKFYGTSLTTRLRQFADICTV